MAVGEKVSTLPIHNPDASLIVHPEPRLLREMLALDDKDVAARIERGMHPNSGPQQAAKDRVFLTSSLASIYLAIMAEPGSSIVLLEPDLQALLFGIVLDSTKYDMQQDSEAVTRWKDEAQDTIDCDAVRLLHVSLRLFTLFVLAVPHLHPEWNDPNDPKSNGADASAFTDPDSGFSDGDVLQKMEDLWQLLYDKRATLFRKRSLSSRVTIAGDTDNRALTLGSVLSTCVYVMGDLWDRVYYSLSQSNTLSLSMPTFNAHFLTWIYGSDDDYRRNRVLERFQRLMRHVGHDRIRSWWPYALVGEEQRSEFASLWRRKILSRTCDSGFYATLMNLFYALAWIPDFQECLKLAQIDVKSPVLWIMKALQRALCARVDDDWNGEAIYCGLGGLIQWCRANGLDAMEMVHLELGVPLLPYLGELAVAATVREPGELKFELLGPMVTIYVGWLKSIGKTKHDFSSAHVQRTWITILQKLRKSKPQKNTAAIIRDWQMVGSAHGFSSDSTLAWLARGNNAKPCPSDAPPWERCGWSGCMCYEQKAIFRLSACTGCWREYYCGKACQKKAWKEGHRLHCRQSKGHAAR